MKLSAPLSAFLNVTSRCNLSCGYCSSPAANTSDLTQEHLRLIAKKLLASEVFRIIITGGEPLCSDSTSDIISLLNGRAAVTMNSNGTLVDMETARFLSRNRVKVSISLDGPDDATNSRSRGLGTFEAAIKGIESCMRAGVRVTILVTVNAFNYNTVDAMCDLCSDLGVSEVSFNPVMAIGRAAQNTNYTHACSRRSVEGVVEPLRSRTARTSSVPIPFAPCFSSKANFPYQDFCRSSLDARTKIREEST